MGRFFYYAGFFCERSGLNCTAWCCCSSPPAFSPRRVLRRYEQTYLPSALRLRSALGGLCFLLAMTNRELAESASKKDSSIHSADCAKVKKRENEKKREHTESASKKDSSIHAADCAKVKNAKAKNGSIPKRERSNFFYSLSRLREGKKTRRRKTGAYRKRERSNFFYPLSRLRENENS